MTVVYRIEVYNRPHLLVDQFRTDVADGLAAQAEALRGVYQARADFADVFEADETLGDGHYYTTVGVAR